MDFLPFDFIKNVANHFSLTSDELEAIFSVSSGWSSMAEKRLQKQNISIYLYFTYEQIFFHIPASSKTKFEISSFDPKRHEVEDFSISCAEPGSHDKICSEEVLHIIFAILKHQKSLLDSVTIFDLGTIFQHQSCTASRVLDSIQGANVLRIDEKFHIDHGIHQKVRELDCFYLLPEALEMAILKLIISGHKMYIDFKILKRKRNFVRELVRAMDQKEGKKEDTKVDWEEKNPIDESGIKWRCGSICLSNGDQYQFKLN
ncbi:hypothetical protein L596_022683 [Steinernema carpocapsae]|uniref:Uncharacterized protein n=1 Tax=Steinernema carpocapsae TaxID=34508 RepID=A0A4U5MMI8_STECR|nr:hypothetical protein L596_022683 [Steinernema carpocapsae]